MRLLDKHRILFISLLIVFFSCLKLLKLNGGVVPGEPDEWSYLEIARNFAYGVLPTASGTPSFYSPPLFMFISFLATFLFPSKFIALRIISLTASAILGWFLFSYLKSKFDFRTALLGMLVYFILPISIFYSRIGLIESFLTTLAFLTFYYSEQAWKEKKVEKALIGGIFLGLTILTKFSAIIILISLGIFFFWELKGLIRKPFNFDRRLIKIPLLIYAIAFLLSAPILLFFSILGRGVFRDQIKLILSIPSTFDPVKYVDLFLTVFTIPVTALFITGLILIILNKRQDMILTLITVFVGLYFIFKTEVAPRYLVILIPYVVIIVSFTFYSLQQAIKNLSQRVIFSLGIGLLFLYVIPVTIVAFRSGYHTFLEEGGKVVGERKETRWVLTNYWPSVFVDQVGYKITWLSNEFEDSAAFSWYPTSKYHKIENSATATIDREGALIILEDLYSQQISKDPKRKEPGDKIRSNYKPVRVVTDTNPNWPFFESSNNKLFIYSIESNY